MKMNPVAPSTADEYIAGFTGDIQTLNRLRRMPKKV